MQACLLGRAALLLLVLGVLSCRPLKLGWHCCREYPARSDCRLNTVAMASECGCKHWWKAGAKTESAMRLKMSQSISKRLLVM